MVPTINNNSQKTLVHSLTKYKTYQTATHQKQSGADIRSTSRPDTAEREEAEIYCERQ